MKIDFVGGRNVLSLAKTALLDNYEMELDMTPLQAVVRLGLVGRYNGTDMVYGSLGDSPTSYYSEHYGTNSAYSGNSTGPEIKANETHRWKIRVLDSVISIFVDNTKVFENDMGKMPLTAGELGIFKDRGAGSVIVDNISIKRIPPVRPESPSEEGIEVKTLITPDMTVRVDGAFPRVIDYTMSNGKIMYGQATAIDTVIINGIDMKPIVTSEVVSDSKIEYDLKLVDFASTINAGLKAELVCVCF